MLDWRFFHDSAAIATRRCAGRAGGDDAEPGLDGSDLAAVFATLVHIRGTRSISTGRSKMLSRAPRWSCRSRSARALRPDAARLSEAGVRCERTLRRHAGSLALAGAMLGYRLPAFVALNEPATSLDPDLLEPLARLIMRVAERPQPWVVTHSDRLARAFTMPAPSRPARWSNATGRPESKVSPAAATSRATPLNVFVTDCESHPTRSRSDRVAAAGVSTVSQSLHLEAIAASLPRLTSISYSIDCPSLRVLKPACSTAEM